MKTFLSFFFSCLTIFAIAQPDRWQQRAEYVMEIDMDVKKHQYAGKQNLTYFNNSPDQLDKVFYHLYFNAFQPGSAMDVRNQTLPDSDKRVKGKIQSFGKDKIGWIKVKSLKMDGKDCTFEHVGTILEVIPPRSIKPGEKVRFDMVYDAQIPKQTRRSGRDNNEGISYSMTQWYPKMCEYDYQGWHANPYIGREFYGIWGDFDVKITIDSDYTIGGTGYLQNPDEIKHGYDGKKFQKPRKKKSTWHFKAPNVHDFAWAADPDYVHTTAQVPNGPTLHFIYQDNDKTRENWEKLPEYTIKAFEYINKNYGVYPYDQYTVIQGGDGGMEYPMSTLITGHRSLRSLVGVTVHEIFHSWYQMALGSNEALYAWMDEGFTSYGSSITMKHLFDPDSDTDPLRRTYSGYVSFVKSGMEEPLSTHADHFVTNRAYGVGSYTKGALFLHQLSYIIGEKNLKEGMIKYYDTWKFKHPNPNDFIRIMEKQSGLELDWYKEYWVNTTHTVDYGIENVEAGDKKNTNIILKRIGMMPMPIDVWITYKDGTKEIYNIPLQIMRGEKKQEDKNIKMKYAEDWMWVAPEYKLSIPSVPKDIQTIEIDESYRLMDIDRSNNKWDASVEGKRKKKKEDKED